MKISLPRNFRFAALPVVFLLFCCFSYALAFQTGELWVTSDIQNSLGTFNFQVQNDGLGTYHTDPINIKKGSYKVKSVFQSNGDWELDTGLNLTSPYRNVLVDLTNPVPGSGSTPPFQTAFVHAHLVSRCSQYGLNTLSITNNQTITCPLVIGFYYPTGSSNLYRIHMTPDSRSIYYYPETDEISITCTGVDANNRCNQWQMEPNGAKGCLTQDCSLVRKNIGKLVQVVTVRGKLTEIDMGDFYLSFSFRVTNP